MLSIPWEQIEGSNIGDVVALDRSRRFSVTRYYDLRGMREAVQSLCDLRFPPPASGHWVRFEDVPSHVRMARPNMLVFPDFLLDWQRDIFVDFPRGDKMAVGVFLGKPPREKGVAPYDYAVPMRFQLCYRHPDKMAVLPPLTLAGKIMTWHRFCLTGDSGAEQSCRDN